MKKNYLAQKKESTVFIANLPIDLFRILKTSCIFFWFLFYLDIRKYTFFFQISNFLCTNVKNTLLYLTCLNISEIQVHHIIATGLYALLHCRSSTEVVLKTWKRLSTRFSKSQSVKYIYFKLTNFLCRTSSTWLVAVWSCRVHIQSDKSCFVGT